MEIAELDEALKVLDSSLSHIKWRLKSSSRRRLHIGLFFSSFYCFRFGFVTVILGVLIIFS